MKKKCLWSLSALMLALVFNNVLVSCSSDDDENSGGAPSGAVAELVSAHVPTQGWNGDIQNGVVTYCPYVVDNSGAEDEYDMDFQPYYAFSFESGKCKNAVFNLVCPSDNIAKQMERVLRDGSWAMEENEDDVKRSGILRNARSRISKMTRAGSDMNLKDLALLVYRSGSVIYIEIECLRGLSSDDVQALILHWEGKSKVIPNKIIVGKWDESTGIYTNNKILQWGITYEIKTGFDGNLLKSYVTTMTFPNATLAQAIFESIEEQNRQIGARTGLYPEAKLEGRTLNEHAVILGDITKEQTLQLIAAIDWMMSQPFFISMFR